jgi:type VI protein secretion system component VasK
MGHAGLPCGCGIDAPVAMEVVAGRRAKRVIAMTALWISLAVVVVFLVVWRLRRATKVLDNILREERELTEREAASEAEPATEEQSVENRNR